ncbi:cardiolipin synthase [Tistlia consotensis]|uniref:Cardiolipin synthase n=1 Tax=Tistlia consotensis USBA 355 TaxID=560819 RepID=A0A1Y6C580_9PROT|nr:cardiolipin synthase [Tistlia consotensis]SMF46238.1 cardiolipin synthase [Tistlia consotensis USBA 355]SNR78733.1 cardiolipin synthase [Tistlia consotensis]
MLSALGTLLTTLLELAAVFFVIKAVRSARTPQGALGWSVFLLAAPYLAIPAYLYLGHARFPGYVSRRRASSALVRKLDQLRHYHRESATDDPNGPLGRVVAFEQMARMPLVSGNAAELLIDGEATFEAIFRAIDRARRYVLIAFYIIRDDAVGQELKRRVVAKAAQGVEVRILYDALGSSALSGSYLEELRAADVAIENFHHLRRPHSRFQRNFRNHRKIVVVDGTVAFVGGHNVGDEYLGRSPRFGHWRDTQVKLEGPVVAEVQLVFAEDWHWATDESLDLDWNPERAAPNVDALVVAPGPADAMETGSLFFCNAIGSARRRIWIASPYFVPDVDILSALKLAALRGVDVRILVADRRDHLLVWLAAFAYFDEVRGAGITVLRYTNGFLHQKVLLVDDDLAAVGSVNLDNRSCRLNFEIAAILFDPRVAARVQDMLEADFRHSYPYETPLDMTPWWLRYGAPLARLFAPIL